MELDLSNDQELLRETTARFIDATCPLSMVRQADRRASRPARGLPPQCAGRARMVRHARARAATAAAASRVRACATWRSSPRSGAGCCSPVRSSRMNVVAAALAAAGSPEQQARILPPSARGEVVGHLGVRRCDRRSGPGRLGHRDPAEGTVSSCRAGAARSGRGAAPTGSSSRPAAPRASRQFLVEADDARHHRDAARGARHHATLRLGGLRPGDGSCRRRSSVTSEAPTGTSRPNSSSPACCPPRRPSAPWTPSSR